MAKRWSPPNDIGSNEEIGRRLFDEEMLRGVAQQPSYSGIQINHFMEKRSDEISLDRLGATGYNKKVGNYLLSRAEAAANTFKPPKPFDGWCYVKAKELTRSHGQTDGLELLASPVEEDESDKPSEKKILNNIYHAHVVRPAKINAHLMALHLRYIFTQFGEVKAIQGTSETTFWKIIWQKTQSFVEFIKNSFRRKRQH